MSAAWRTCGQMGEPDWFTKPGTLHTSLQLQEDKYLCFELVIKSHIWNLEAGQLDIRHGYIDKSKFLNFSKGQNHLISHTMCRGAGIWLTKHSFEVMTMTKWHVSSWTFHKCQMSFLQTPLSTPCTIRRMKGHIVEGQLVFEELYAKLWLHNKFCWPFSN